MKNLYYFILFASMLLISCSREIKEIDTTEHLYLCNTLEKNVTLTLFKNGEVLEYAIKPNDTLYFTTIDNNETRAVELRESKLNKYLNSFDSATITYNSLLYTFTNNYDIYSSPSNITESTIVNDSILFSPCILWITEVYPILAYHGKKNCTYSVYNEDYFEYLEEKIKRKHYQTYYENDVYINNRLDDTINLEVFKEEKLSTFTLTPDDTIYFTTIEYCMIEGDKPNEFPGTNAHRDFIGSIDSVNIFYNNKKYTYTKPDNKIQHLFYIYDFQENGYWMIAIDENKKQELGWE